MLYPFFSGLEYLYGLNRMGGRFRGRTATPGFAGDGPLTAYGSPATYSSSAPHDDTGSLSGFSGFGGFGMGDGMGEDGDGANGGPSHSADAMRPWAVDEHGTGHAADPFAPDRDSRHRALGRGLMAAGIGLLEGAGTGDMTGGIARATAGFSQARDASLDRDRSLALQAVEERRRDAAERRMEAAEGRATAQEDDRDRLADVQFDAATEELHTFRETQDRGRQLRSATGKSADQMVDEINTLAAANPKDQTLQRMAQRAIGYSLGEDSDLNKLAVLHEQMTARLGRDTDADWERGQGLATAEAQARHGYGPIAEGSRSDRNLGMEARRLDLYGQEVSDRMSHREATAGSSGDHMPSVGQQADDIRQEANTIYSTWLQGRMKGVGELVLGSFNPDGSPVRKQPPSADEIAQARAGALMSAQRSYEAQLGSLRQSAAVGVKGGTGAPPTTGAVTGTKTQPPVFHYDPKTGTMLRAFPVDNSLERVDPILREKDSAAIMEEIERHPDSHLHEAVEKARKNKTISPDVEMTYASRPHGPNAPGAGIVAPESVERYANPYTPVMNAQTARDQAGNPIVIYTPRSKWEGAALGVDNPRVDPARVVIQESDPVLHGEVLKSSLRGKIEKTLEQDLNPLWQVSERLKRNNEVSDYFVKPKPTGALEGLDEKTRDGLYDRLNRVANDMKVDMPIAWMEGAFRLMRKGGTDKDVRKYILSLGPSE